MARVWRPANRRPHIRRFAYGTPPNVILKMKYKAICRIAPEWRYRTKKVKSGTVRGLDLFYDLRRSRCDRLHSSEIRQEQLPELPLDNQENVKARLVSLSDLLDMMLTAPVIPPVGCARTAKWSAGISA